jgi:hypothetical protein
MLKALLFDLDGALAEDGTKKLGCSRRAGEPEGPATRSSWRKPFDRFGQ